MICGQKKVINDLIAPSLEIWLKPILNLWAHRNTLDGGNIYFLSMEDWEEMNKNSLMTPFAHIIQTVFNNF